MIPKTEDNVEYLNYSQLNTIYRANHDSPATIRCRENYRLVSSAYNTSTGSNKGNFGDGTRGSYGNRYPTETKAAEMILAYSLVGGEISDDLRQKYMDIIVQNLLLSGCISSDVLRYKNNYADYLYKLIFSDAITVDTILRSNTIIDLFSKNTLIFNKKIVESAIKNADYFFERITNKVVNYLATNHNCVMSIRSFILDFKLYGNAVLEKFDVRDKISLRRVPLPNCCWEMEDRKPVKFFLTLRGSLNKDPLLCYFTKNGFSPAEREYLLTLAFEDKLDQKEAMIKYVRSFIFEQTPKGEFYQEYITVIEGIESQIDKEKLIIRQNKITAAQMPFIISTNDDSNEANYGINLEMRDLIPDSLEKRLCEYNNKTITNQSANPPKLADESAFLRDEKGVTDPNRRRDKLGFLSGETIFARLRQNVNGPSQMAQPYQMLNTYLPDAKQNLLNDIQMIKEKEYNAWNMRELMQLINQGAGMTNQVANIFVNLHNTFLGNHLKPLHAALSRIFELFMEFIIWDDIKQINKHELDDDKEKIIMNMVYFMKDIDLDSLENEELDPELIRTLYLTLSFIFDYGDKIRDAKIDAIKLKASRPKGSELANTPEEMNSLLDIQNQQTREGDGDEQRDDKVTEYLRKQIVSVISKIKFKPIFNFTVSTALAKLEEERIGYLIGKVQHVASIIVPLAQMDARVMARIDLNIFLDELAEIMPGILQSDEDAEETMQEMEESLQQQQQPAAMEQQPQQLM